MYESTKLSWLVEISIIPHSIKSREIHDVQCIYLKYFEFSENCFI